MSTNPEILDMSPQEVDFYVEDHLIHILPNFTSGQINLIAVSLWATKNKI
jgi:hypothetical protein